MTRKIPKIKTAVNTCSSSMPKQRHNIFLELHKMDYEKRRLEHRSEIMDKEQEFIAFRVSTLNKDIGKTLNALKTNHTSQKGRSTNKLKY